MYTHAGTIKATHYSTRVRVHASARERMHRPASEPKRNTPTLEREREKLSYLFYYYVFLLSAAFFFFAGFFLPLLLLFLGFCLFRCASISFVIFFNCNSYARKCVYVYTFFSVSMHFDYSYCTFVSWSSMCALNHILSNDNVNEYIKIKIFTKNIARARIRAHTHLHAYCLEPM